MVAKRVRIQSCRDSQYWYARHIGSCFELLSVSKKHFWVIDAQGFTNCVERSDACLAVEGEHDH